MTDQPTAELVAEARKGAEQFRRIDATGLSDLLDRLADALEKTDPLAQRLAEAERDTQRLDWLEANDGNVIFHEPEDKRWFTVDVGGKESRADTIREAIDAAMRQSGDGEEASGE